MIAFVVAKTWTLEFDVRRRQCERWAGNQVCSFHFHRIVIADRVAREVAWRDATVIDRQRVDLKRHGSAVQATHFSFDLHLEEYGLALDATRVNAAVPQNGARDLDVDADDQGIRATIIDRRATRTHYYRLAERHKPVRRDAADGAFQDAFIIDGGGNRIAIVVINRACYDYEFADRQIALLYIDAVPGERRIRCVVANAVDNNATEAGDRADGDCYTRASDATRGRRRWRRNATATAAAATTSGDQGDCQKKRADVL